MAVLTCPWVRSPIEILASITMIILHIGIIDRELKLILNITSVGFPTEHSQLIENLTVDVEHNIPNYWWKSK